METQEKPKILIWGHRHVFPGPGMCPSAISCGTMTSDHSLAMGRTGTWDEAMAKISECRQGDPTIACEAKGTEQ